MIPDRTSPQGILSIAAKRPLRPGELDALALYVSGLERQAASAKEALAAASACEHVNLSLSHDGAALNLTLPGAPPHTIRLPTQDSHLAMRFLVQTLRSRNAAPEAPHPIGTAGAPTAADLAALAKASRRQPSATKPTAQPLALSLADLGL